MNPSSTGAIMGQSRYKVVPPAEVSAAQEDGQLKVQWAKKEENETASLASLLNNSGWIILEQKMQKRIEAFKSGSYLVDAVASNVDTQSLGELLKVEMKVAAQLESFIRDVHTAYSALETEKQERRNAVRNQRRS